MAEREACPCHAMLVDVPLPAMAMLVDVPLPAMLVDVPLPAMLDVPLTRLPAMLVDVPLPAMLVDVPLPAMIPPPAYLMVMLILFRTNFKMMQGNCYPIGDLGCCNILLCHIDNQSVFIYFK